MLFEPAFPDTQRPGMCLRDYVAIKAMAAILQSRWRASPDFRSLAAEAYEVADAMLEARKPPGPDWIGPRETHSSSAANSSTAVHRAAGDG